MSLYWFYVLGNAQGILCILLGLSIVATIALGVKHMVDVDWDGDSPSKKPLIWSVIVSILLIIGCTFSVSTESLMKIYVLDNTLEYLENNEQAKQLPDKVIECCDKILNEAIEEEER